jgi:2-oxoglutarate ferredoxin oxidoreductase subunit beta
MLLRQKSELRPSAYRDSVDTPFRPNNLPTGILMKNQRPEYGVTYRRQAGAAAAAAAARKGAPR